ncbi:hypothetical protein AYO40_05775 [Planctomycetaceae bacterium SCGC AG-212-D15]|nr:hypothetical protein AYO40_05775 [Planctomycetaceae bacterium SCGC AG-212-D15]
MKTVLFEIGKIIQGALAGDHQMVVAYAMQLSDKLESEGEVNQAKKIRKLITSGHAGTVELALLGSRQPAGDNIPSDLESHLPTADCESLSSGQVELFLEPEAQAVVDGFLRYFRASDQLREKGVGITPSMLIYGPPGSGKTHTAKWIASQVGLPLITARADGLISSYLGSTAKNIRHLFDYAMANPCVLFLDEFDAVAKMRDDSRELGELKRVVISLLQNIDTMPKDHMLLAATNHEHLLDKAIWRRFGYRLHLSDPNPETRRKMIASFLGAYSSEDVVDVLLAITDGVTGATIRHICDECIRSAILENRPDVCLSDAVNVSLAHHPRVPTGHTLSFPDQAKMLRRLNAKSFTQVRLARIFGVSQPQMSRWLKEAGHAAG